MKTTTRTILALLIAAALGGTYLIVEANREPSAAPGENASRFGH